MITKHESSFLRRMGMEVYKHLQALVLLRLLNYGFLGCPDSWMISLGGVQVHPVQIAGHRV